MIREDLETGTRSRETAFETVWQTLIFRSARCYRPGLEGTNGKLFVSQVYLNELKYENLEIDFKDGMIFLLHLHKFCGGGRKTKYIRDNVLKHHDTLPMGEFAIRHKYDSVPHGKRFSYCGQASDLYR